MPSLRELQLAFASSVLGDDARCMQGLVLEAGFSTEERLRIYRNNARIGFHGALVAAFPVIAQLGGADWFESVALRYQRRHPSRCGDLQYVGERFAQFLQSDLSGSGYEWIAEVARLEWAYQEVLVARDDPALQVSELASLTPEQQEWLSLVPRADVRLVSSPVPVLAIWKAHQPGGDSHFSLEGPPSHVLVARRSDHVEMRELPSDQALLLEALNRGDLLAEASCHLADRMSEIELGAALRRLLQLEAFGAMRLPSH
ncbi:MAG: DNA-binding domain-containing protein [Steroidobacteraceae bacterium]